MTAITPNTDKIYKCIRCGSSAANIIREAPNLDATRVKCTSCGMLYSAADSKQLEDKGEIPSEPPKVQDDVQPVDRSRGEVPERRIKHDDVSAPAAANASFRVPKTPAFVFIARGREKVEFSTKRDLKKTVLSWEHQGLKYDIFELVPKTVHAKIDIT